MSVAKKRTSGGETGSREKIKNHGWFFRGGSASRRRSIDVQDVSRDHEAYLDDGVQELLGLAARLDDVVPFGLRVVVGVVRAFASVPLRRGGSGSGTNATVGVRRSRGESRRRASRETRGTHLRGVGLLHVGLPLLHDLLLCVWSGEKEARRRGGSASGGCGRRGARRASFAREANRPESRAIAVFARGTKRWRSRARGRRRAPSATLSRSLRGSSGARVRGHRGRA